MREAVRWIFAPLVEHKRALLVLNVVYFGSVILGAIYAAIDPESQQALLEAVGEAFSPTGTLGPVVQAYQQGQLGAAILSTFVVNLLLGSLVVLTLPSLIIPFAGLIMGEYRALLWGVLFSPAGVLDPALLPHLLTLILEGEAYIVAILGVWLWWWPVFRRSGRRWNAWLSGLRLQWRIYVAVAMLLAIAATYEALEVIYLIPRLAGGA